MIELLWFLLIGLAAGWLAGQLMKTGGGMLTNMIVGVIGAVLGGWLFRYTPMASGGLLGSLLMATIGAVIVLAILRLVQQRK